MSQVLTQIRVRDGSDFERRAEQVEGRPMTGLTLDTVQVNIGLVCNLACHHCHVESSPTRTEEMTWETMQLVLDAAVLCDAKTVDITGGAPEMHPHFRRFVTAAVALGKHVMVRTNLTILLEAGYEDLPVFFREHRVHLIASLPCYLETNVDKQRGRGVYVESIEAIKRLNAIGYGLDKLLPLDLVYNPGGPSLPPKQGALETDYRRELSARFGIAFTRLITIANMPIGRFQHDLERQGRGQAYLQMLRDKFNPATLSGLMCRHQIHVGHDGRVYDCDFNYAIGLPVSDHSLGHIGQFDLQRFVTRSIATGEHCYGCTAGAGSSCGGAVV